MVISNMKLCNSDVCVKIIVINVVLTYCVWFFWSSWSQPPFLQTICEITAQQKSPVSM